MSSSQTCSTCGTTLHSDISRAFGQCGACRSGSERGEPYQPQPAPAPKDRESPVPPPPTPSA